MNAQRAPHSQQEHRQIRAVYEEYTLRNGRVAMVSDPFDEYAWIQTNHTVPVRR